MPERKTVLIDSITLSRAEYFQIWCACRSMLKYIPEVEPQRAVLMQAFVKLSRALQVAPDIGEITPIPGETFAKGAKLLAEHAEAR